MNIAALSTAFILARAKEDRTTFHIVVEFELTSLPNDELTVDEENDEILIAVVVKKEGFPDVTLCRVVLNKPILDVSLLL